MCEIMEQFGEKIGLQSMAESITKGKAEGRLNALVELIRDGCWTYTMQRKNQV